MLLGEMSEIEKSQFLTQQRQFQKLTADIDEMEKEIESTRIQSHQEWFQLLQRTNIRLKKSSKEGCFTWSHTHEILRWLIFSILKFWDGSKFEKKMNSSYRTFRILSHLKNEARDRDFDPFRNWSISKSHAYDFTWNMPASMTFWAISNYPLYFVRLEIIYYYIGVIYSLLKSK